MMSVDLGALVVVGMVLLGATLVVLAIAARVLGLGSTLRPIVRRRECAECGYAVDGLPGAHCPECGVDLRVGGIVEPGSERPTRWRPAAIVVGATGGAMVASCIVPQLIGALPGVRAWERTEHSRWMSESRAFVPADVTTVWRGGHSFLWNSPDIATRRAGVLPVRVTVTVAGNGNPDSLIIDHRAGTFEFAGALGLQGGRLPLKHDDLERFWSASGDLRKRDEAGRDDGLKTLASVLNSPGQELPVGGGQYIRPVSRGHSTIYVTPRWAAPVLGGLIWVVWGWAVWRIVRRWRAHRASVNASRLRRGQGASSDQLPAQN